MTILLSILFLALMFLGMPVAFAVGVSSLVFYLTSDTIPAQIGVQRIATATQSFPLLAVPLFVLAGNLMNSSGITDRIISLARALTGWITGGLAQVAIGGQDCVVRLVKVPGEPSITLGELAGLFRRGTNG